MTDRESWRIRLGNVGRNVDREIGNKGEKRGMENAWLIEREGREWSKAKGGGREQCRERGRMD